MTNCAPVGWAYPLWGRPGLLPGPTLWEEIKIFFNELSRNRTCIKSLEDFCLIRWTISSFQLLYEIYTKKTIEETLIF